MIKATQRAIPQLRRILGQHKAVFFGAKGGGCSGFEYHLHPTNKVHEHHNELVSIGGVPMVMCGKSMFLLFGTDIDWQEDTMGSRFTFTNPNSSGTCGCGSTFSVD